MKKALTALLVFAWVMTVAFIGPYLISQPSWVAVGLGFTLIGGLVFATYKRFFENE